jgi:protein-L-isoaspartate(D-aspartate) O-methyltransferase
VRWRQRTIKTMTIEPDPIDNTDYPELRRQMVETQIHGRGISDEVILSAMRSVPRHRFVPADLHAQAYEDKPLSIGQKQTISQPYIVAFMTERLRPRPGHRVLEIGTGSGYQAAILAEVVEHVFTMEILIPLAITAESTLRKLRYNNVSVRPGDGSQGWSDLAPLDGIIITAAPKSLPLHLLPQLAVGGRLVVPVGQAKQELFVITKTENSYTTEFEMAVRFVPMTGAISQD